MEYRKLGSTGLRVSTLSFGAAPLGDMYGTMTDADASHSVHQALDAGINFFDTAVYYGKGVSETRLGTALRGRRSEAILATKCARFGLDDFDFSAARACSSIDESLRRLQTDYVDIFHVHDIEFGDKRQIVDETLPALRNIQKSGKARFIGITGLVLPMLHEVAKEFPVDAILSYCRFNLLNQDLDRELAPFCARNGIGLISASPLHMGLLSPAGGPPWHPAPENVRIAAREVVRLCQDRGADVSVVALQFALRHPVVATTLVGISSPEQLKRNLAALESEPDPDLLAAIEEVVAPVRGEIWNSGRPENN